MFRINLYRVKLERDVKMSKELVLHCSREESLGLQEQVLKVMVELGLRIVVKPSISKQSLVWEAYNQDSTLALKYTKRYDYGNYTLQVDVHNLGEEKLKSFYERWKKE